MQRQITPNQCYCSFGDGIVYEFVATSLCPLLQNCRRCAFSSFSCSSFKQVKCLSAPCIYWQRKDYISGFWRISEIIDYQVFEKMLENGG